MATSIDFPLDKPPSLQATRLFFEKIDAYLALFDSRGEEVAIEAIRLGSVENPRLTAPIEISPEKIAEMLNRSRQMLTEAVAAAQDSARLTREVVEKLQVASAEAIQRADLMEQIAAELNRLLAEYRYMAWHPGLFAQVQAIAVRRFRPGEPGVAVHITVLV